MRTWQGRIDAPTSGLFEAFTSSTVQDAPLAPYDVRASVAHARALKAAGPLDEADADRMIAALQEIGDEIAAGHMVWRDELEDVHTHIEVRLHEKIGDLAGALHTGRSRNDQIATDVRLYTKDQIAETLDGILALQSSFLMLADRYRSDLMSGYTHLQQAQPVLIAQTLLVYVAMLERDWQRFRQILDRTDLSPLGSGAVSGASFSLDRTLLAREAGFAGVVSNAMDAISDRDFLVEFVSAAALCMTHLSRFAEDLIIWSSTEFGYVRLPDAFSSGSSMMPQKKNPDAAELIRGKTALVIGDAAGALALVKALPLSYNRDLQEDKTPLYHASETLLNTLQLLTAMVPELEFNTARTESAISPFALATDLADHLVRAGLPFRQAHGVVARLVAQCIEQGRTLTDLSDEELSAASPLLAGAPRLSPRASVEGKATAGSTNPSEVESQLAHARKQIADRTNWREERERTTR
jgi:argininosuccinate lyase